MTTPDTHDTAPERDRQFLRPVDKDNLRWFWADYFRPRLKWLFVVFALILAQAFVYQQFLSITENGLRVIFDSGAVGDLALVCLAVFSLFAFRGIASYATQRLGVWLASDAVMDLRKDLLRHILHLDLAFFDRTAGADIIHKVYNQTEALGMFVGQQTVNAVRDIATIIVVAGYLVIKSPLLSLAAVIVPPIITLVIRVLSHQVKKRQAAAEDAFAGYLNNLEETTSAMRTVQISGQQAQEEARLMASSEAVKRVTVKLHATQALSLPALDIVSALVYVIVIGGGGFMVLHPDYDMDGAAIITFLLGMVLIFDPLRRFSQFVTRFQANLIVLDSVRDLFRERATITDAPAAVATFDTAGDIVFDQVRFAYSPDKPLFEDLSLGLAGGSVTALVGSTGSGKTTVLSLLSRLYALESGAITIGGTSINDIKVDALRGAFSVVAQDIVVFNASLMDNIRYVKPDATEAEVWAAAEAAEIAELMRARGDAPLGARGSQLSGGQRQRIGIARAFLRDAPILLLDEATSALDQQTEDRVKRALARLSAGRTTIIVAHRLSSVTDADQIIVMEAGRVAEHGTHEALVANEGLYAAMYAAQKDGYASQPPKP
ncbi:MAG: ABC transporter ATP-binding protein [Pseudomonadota bacterium]